MAKYHPPALNYYFGWWVGPFRPLEAVGGKIPPTTSFILLLATQPQKMTEKKPWSRTNVAKAKMTVKTWTIYLTFFLVSKTFSVLFFSNWIDIYPSGVPKMTPIFRSFSHHRRLWKGDVLKPKKWISVRDEW